MMRFLKEIFFFAIGIALILASFYLVLQKPAPDKYQSVIKAGEKSIVVEVADTDEERARGLSGRASLERGHGLLFVFPEPGLYGFWMKDMRFPIDIAWLDLPAGEAGEAFHVVDIERNVGPDSFPHIFYPPTPVKYVLETNPGEL